MTMKVTDQDFKEKVLEKSKEIPIVVDFWAEWCMPCLMLGPFLEKMEKEYAEKFILAKLNVNEGRKISTIYGINAIPAVKMFKNGKVVDEFVGALPKEQVEEWFDKNLEK